MNGFGIIKCKKRLMGAFTTFRGTIVSHSIVNMCHWKMGICTRFARYALFVCWTNGKGAMAGENSPKWVEAESIWLFLCEHLFQFKTNKTMEMASNRCGHIHTQKIECVIYMCVMNWAVNFTTKCQRYVRLYEYYVDEFILATNRNSVAAFYSQFFLSLSCGSRQ